MVMNDIRKKTLNDWINELETGIQMFSFQLESLHNKKGLLIHLSGSDDWIVEIEETIQAYSKRINVLHDRIFLLQTLMEDKNEKI